MNHVSLNINKKINKYQFSHPKENNTLFFSSCNQALSLPIAKNRLAESGPLPCKEK